jgi:uncharacterized SAM-binding protein YcdF (DUF218 family)
MMDIMLKHVVTGLLLPPGIFILLLSCMSLRQSMNRNGGHALALLVVAASLWAFSAAPLSDRLMADLEKGQSIPADPKDGVIVLLGGGVEGGAPDAGGTGVPTGDMMVRLVAAARLQRRTGLPLVVSGGQAFENMSPEAPVLRRLLVDLGVPPARILVEDKSRDTRENAALTRRLLERRSLRKAILVTSAFHMRRARFLFEREGVDVVSYPTDFRTWPGKTYGRQDYLPTASALRNSVLALKECLGYGWYRLSLRGAPTAAGGGAS